MAVLAVEPVSVPGIEHSTRSQLETPFLQPDMGGNVDVEGAVCPDPDQIKKRHPCSALVGQFLTWVIWFCAGWLMRSYYPADPSNFSLLAPAGGGQMPDDNQMNLAAVMPQESQSKGVSLWERALWHDDVIVGQTNRVSSAPQAKESTLPSKKTPALAQAEKASKSFLDSASWVSTPTLRFNNSCFFESQKAHESILVSSFLKRHQERLGQNPQHKALTQPTTDGRAFTDVSLKFQQDCERWVAQTTDATWHSIFREDRSAAIDKYFSKDFESHILGYAVGGHKMFRGIPALKSLVEGKLEQIPDLKIRILNTLCTPFVHDELGLLGFFTTMPDLSRGTFIPPAAGNTRGDKERSKSRQLAYFGNAVSFVALDPESGRWQYQAEIVTHDDASMLAELGEDAKYILGPHAPQPEAIVEKLSPHVQECDFPQPWFEA